MMNSSIYMGMRSTASPGCSYHLGTQKQVHKQQLYRKANSLTGSCKRCKLSLNARKGRYTVYAARDYYEVLGVPRDADLKQIKQAFKKKALKLHPDVNKAADAKERFMECKVAYQALSDASERARYDRSKGMGGPDGNFSWEDVVSSGARSRKAAEEAFYGLGDFFRDLDRDRVERRRSKGRPEQPMSLWEELSDIGEEFVEFLEKEIGLSAPREPADSSERAYETEASAEQARRQVREAEERARRAAATAEEGARKVNDDIEEMLQKMKKDLGVK